MAKLSKYKNIVAWALVELYDNDKTKMLLVLNRLSLTSYNRDHLNNWLSERKPIPRWIVGELGAKLLDLLTVEERVHVKRLLELNQL